MFTSRTHQIPNCSTSKNLDWPKRGHKQLYIMAGQEPYHSQKCI